MGKKAQSVVDILSLLPKDNCRECGDGSCMVFAVKVLRGARPLGDCPYVEAGVDVSVRAPNAAGGDEVDPEDRENTFHRAMDRIPSVDFERTAHRLGLRLRGERIVVPVLGRLFEVGPRGTLHSNCHINSWVHLPILQFLLDGMGKPLTGSWVSYADLDGTADWVRFFDYRCVGGLERLACRDVDLFFDTLELFEGTRGLESVSGELLTADFSARLELLPGVAMLFRFWQPDGEFEAKLSVLFDSASGENLDARSLYYLTQGILEMFTRIASKHGQA